jgi:hypothetical protein
MTVSGMLYVCWLRRMASGPPHSNIYMTERTGFPLIRLHHMNLPLNVRIGKTLLHLERVLVYIALQGALGSLMRNLIIQHNDSVSVMLSTTSKIFYSGPSYKQLLLTDTYDLLTVRISLILVSVRDHHTRMSPCGPSHHLGNLPWNRCR